MHTEWAKKSTVKPRPVVVRCTHGLRSKIFGFTKNLKGLKNDLNDNFSVRPQLPEPLLTEKREREDQLMEIRRTNAGIPEEQKHKRVQAIVKNKTLYVNNVAQKKYVVPPTATEILNVEPDQQQKMNELQVSHSEFECEKGSSFSGHAVRVKNTTEIKLAYRKVCAMFPESDHVMMAYNVKTFTGYHDDGEFGAAKRILNILQSVNMPNTVVFVTREYGGFQLGQRRFMYIERVC